jgi:hypothetical protein
MNALLEGVSPKRKNLSVSAAVGALLISALVGCDTREPKEEVRPVDWYVEHEAERAAQLMECRSNPKILDATPNCVNASRAENEAKAQTKWGTSNEEVRTVPPVPPVP